MISMSRVESIRQKYKDGKPIMQICREEKVDYKTARKWIELEDFNEKLPVKEEKPKILDDYKEEIITLLTENKGNWYKQYLTSKRVFDLFKEKHQDLDVSYATVNRFVQDWKKNNNRKVQQGYSHLVWHEGEAQADFGEADFHYEGSTVRFKYFVLSFPQSNKSFVQIFRGENCECVCQALENIFEYLKGVPRVIVFDNATGIGHVFGKILEESRLFKRFRMHYMFDARFCNPNAGHEKGSVESNVRYIRLNLFTPLIDVDKDIQEYNMTKLFSLCERLMEKRIHYIKNVPVNQLFENDRNALYHLPCKAFDVKNILTLKTDKYSCITIDRNHRYTLPEEYACRQVLVETRAWTVTAYDVRGQKIIEYERIYDRKLSESVNEAIGITALIRKPGMWQNSRFRENLKEDNPFRMYVDTLPEPSHEQKHKVFYEFKKAMDSHPYETVLKAFSELAVRNMDMTNECNVTACCDRLENWPPEYTHNGTGVDLNKYGMLMNEKEEPLYEF